jgi:hypothetical protein
MKKGFFCLMLALLFVRPLFAESPTNDYPEGDIEKFFLRIKAACEKPDTAGNQLPPEHIMISCEDMALDWVPGKGGQTRKLSRSGSLDVAIFCDKDLGKLKEGFGLSIDPVEADCPQFDQIKITRKMTVNTITCADVNQYGTATEFCNKVLEEATAETANTGKSVNLCGGGSGQQPYASGTALNYPVKK